MLFLAAAPLLAAGRAEVSGSIGHAGTSDDEGSIGSGLGAGFSAGYRLAGRRLGFEADYGYARYFRENRVGFEGRSHFVLGNLLVHFRGESRVQPYLLFGGGLAHHINLHAGQPGRHVSSTGPAVAIGAGIKAFVTEHVYVRSEARASAGIGRRFYSSVEPPLGVTRVSIGLGYRW